MGVGGTGEGPGQMWDVEKGGRGTRCGQGDVSPKSPFKPGSGKCSLSHASTPTPTAGWISKVTSQIESSQILSFVFWFLVFFNILCSSGRSGFMISL